LILLLNEIAQEQGGMDFFIMPDSDDLANIPQDPKNPLTSEKVRLGQFLFHETALAIEPLKESAMFTYSCASCHSAGSGFQAGKAQGIGEGGLGFGLFGSQRIINPDYQAHEIDAQDVRSPSIVNTAYQKVQTWDGKFGATDINVGTESEWFPTTPTSVNHLGYEGIESQAIGALDVHRQNIDISHLEQFGYRELFDAAFPNFPVESRYTEETVGLAIAAYERTVFTQQAPFQRWLKGDLTAMSEPQKQGAILFFNKANCNSCHTGAALNTMSFHALGMNDLAGDVHGVISETSKQGRGGFTDKIDDYYKFKTPQLYNLKDSPFYGHGASFTSIRQVIEYKNEARPENINVPTSQLASDFIPLHLTVEEIEQLVEFIEAGLHDPNLDRYEPSTIPSNLCFPVADPVSVVDLGCD